MLRRIDQTKNMPATNSSRCTFITDDEVELYVLGRLQNEAAAEHLSACPNCASRISKSREYVALMKAALKEYRRSVKR